MLFIPLEKIDIKQRLVYGTIAAEEADGAGEILDYASAKQAFQKWSDKAVKLSGGKSYGNVRSMHNRTAAGKVAQPLHFDDELKKISACVYVADDAEWAKVQEGVFTGFSPGGGYAKMWQDASNPRLKRYTPVVIELSLVDVPCQPSAGFSCIKADGTTELMKFKYAEEAGDLDQGFRAKDGRFFKVKIAAEKWNKYLAEAEKAREEVETAVTHPALEALQKAQEAVDKLEEDDQDAEDEEEDNEDEKKKKMRKALLDEMAKADLSTEGRKKEAEAGEAMPDGSYPIKTKDDLHNAVQAFGRAKNKPKTKAHIKKRAKALGATEMLPKKWGKLAEADGLAKGFGEVARLAQIIQDLDWLKECCEMEQEHEGDDASDQPDALQGAVELLCEIIKDMVAEEGAELGDCMDGNKCIDLPRSVVDQFTKLIGTEHPIMQKIKAIEPVVIVPPTEELMKLNQALETVTGDLAAERKVTSELADGMMTLAKRLETIERQPMPPRGPLRAVDRHLERKPAMIEHQQKVTTGTDTLQMPAGLSPIDQRAWKANQQRLIDQRNRH